MLGSGPAAARQGEPAALLPGVAGNGAAGRAGIAPGRAPGDTRRAVDPAAMPWRALGRIQTALGTRCTGVLVGPRTVLTAAHCLIAPNSNRPVQPGSVHFLLGYANGVWVSHAVAGSFRLGPGFTPDTRQPAGADWAVVTLAQALPGATPLPVLPTLPNSGAAALGGYEQDRSEVLIADTACRVLGAGRDPSGATLLVHDCNATRGASGGPLLVRDGAGWAVAGIAVRARSDAGGGVAVPAAAIPLNPPPTP